MGFYSPATLIKDAQRHGIKIRSVSVMDSEWFCTVESDVSLKLGFCLTHGINQAHVEQMINARQQRLFQNMHDFRERTSFDRDELRILAKAGILNPLIGHRRDALWAVENELHQGELFSDVPEKLTSPLPPMQPVERLAADFCTMRLTTGPHPMAYLRTVLTERYLAQRGSVVWRKRDPPADCRPGDLSATPWYCERLCLYQPGRRNRNLQRDRQSADFRKEPAGHHPGNLFVN